MPRHKYYTLRYVTCLYTYILYYRCSVLNHIVPIIKSQMEYLMRSCCISFHLTVRIIEIILPIHHISHDTHECRIRLETLVIVNKFDDFTFIGMYQYRRIRLGVKELEKDIYYDYFFFFFSFKSDCSVSLTFFCLHLCH